MDNTQSTIAAICTPPGDGGVAMIRLSGPEAFSIANHFFSKNVDELTSHQMVYGSFLNTSGLEVDQGLLVKMKGPKSYTGENVVEIFCHGGRLITQQVLKLVLESGAKIAKPGEFTQRAYLNGKMDLAQAEAVQSLISAQNEYALKMASGQLEGALSKKIQSMQKKMIEQAAILEAWVDFPEEGIEFCSLNEIISKLKNLADEIQYLLKTFHDGQALKEGFSICLLGSPNVGKSSLMNQLLKKDRAIVTPIAGTTRDSIEERLWIEGMEYRLIDTAGVRETYEIIEKEGIERALNAAKKSDLILFVLDQSKALSDEERKLVDEIKNQNVLFIKNKMDLDIKLDFSSENEIELSAKTGENIEGLFQKISDMTTSHIHLKDQIYLSELRHKKALEKAYENLNKVITGLETEASPEWLTFDLKNALKNLGEIIGLNITEDILSNIFSRFCIGK